MNRVFIFLAPVSVVVFIIILAVMYGWVDGTDIVGGEGREVPELNLVNNPTFPAGIGNGQIQLINNPTFSAGIGSPQNSQIQLIDTILPTGIGNGQMRLINNPTFPAGIGNGQNGQIQLINNPTFPAGIGNGQIQLINNPTFPAGIGSPQDSQIQLIKQTIPTAPYLGLGLVKVPSVLANELKLSVGTGVYIQSIAGLSPAEKAGLKVGDVILKFDGKDITAHEQIGQIMATRKIGDVIKVVVNRNKGKKSFHVKLESSPNGVTSQTYSAQTSQPITQNVQTPVAQTVTPSTQTTLPSGKPMPFQPPPVKSPVIWMGADIQDIDAVMQMQFYLPDTRGAIVSYVSPNSPAMTAGLAIGDVIRRFNTTRIRDVKQFQSMVLKGQPGQQIEITVLRSGTQLTIPVVLGQQTPVPEKIPFIGPADIVIEAAWIGMDVSQLTSKDVSSLGLPTGTRGILVNDVEGPPATMVGFAVNDVLITVNGEPIPDIRSFEKATQKQNGAVVDVIRGNKHLFISVPPPGFTQQGTKINQPIDNKIKKVAMTQQMLQPQFQSGVQPQFQQSVQPQSQQNIQTGRTGTGQRFGIFASTPDLNTSVAGNTSQTPYLIMVDLSNNSFALIDPTSLGNVADTFSQNNLSALVCSDISRQTAADLSGRGITIYAGVIGTANTAIDLYQSGGLTPARGL